MSTRGIVTARPDGSLSNLQAEHIAMEASGAGATLYRETDGMRAIVATLSQSPSTSAGVGSYAQARLVRKAQP
uniref:Uncharacterized protein n=1 Tax=Chryseobacterium sp. B5 TaxID=2050562 RepID=A0A2G7SUT0_9FLAO